MPDTVYIVEDDDAVRESLEWMLCQESLQVESFAKPSEILAVCDRLKQGCLVIDLILPEMNGLELRRELVRRKCALPFVIITGHGEVEDAWHAFQDGAIDFIEKPIHRGVLIQSIGRALAKFAAQQEEIAEVEALSHCLDAAPEQIRGNLRSLCRKLIRRLNGGELPPASGDKQQPLKPHQGHWGKNKKQV